MCVRSFVRTFPAPIDLRQSDSWIPANSLYVREAARKSRICSPGVGPQSKSTAADTLFGIMISRF